MVQESSIFGDTKDDDHCTLSKIDSSCLIEGASAISLVDEDEEKEEEEEELKRRKREKLIQYYIQRHENFLKNPNVCVDAIGYLNDLIPRGTRSKRSKPSYKIESFSTRKNKKSRMMSSMTMDNTLNEKIQELEVKIFEVSLVIEKERIPKTESFLKNEKKKRTLYNKKVNRVSKAILPIKFKNKIQELEGKTSEVSLVMEKEPTPKTEPFLKLKKKRRTLYNKKVNRVSSQAMLPMKLKNKIEELGVPISNVSLVIEKSLFITDLSEKHMRLSIPMNQVVNAEFLTTQEKDILDTKDSTCNRWSQIKFKLIEPSLEESNIHLAKWPMNSSFSYVLLNGWISVIKRNNLKVNMMVQLWSFRKDSNPWLALVVVPSEALDAAAN